MIKYAVCHARDCYTHTFSRTDIEWTSNELVHEFWNANCIEYDTIMEYDNIDEARAHLADEYVRTPSIVKMVWGYSINYEYYFIQMREYDEDGEINRIEEFDDTTGGGWKPSERV